jgi:arginase
MTIIAVPYHQDEQLPADHIPLPARTPVVNVTPDFPDGEIWDRLTSLYAAVASAVTSDIEAGSVPTIVSGDCLVSLGVVAGVQRAGINPTIIWFDAHGDVHTFESSTSGYLGGMSLRLVLGAHYSLVGERVGLRPLPEQQAVLVDARDLDPAEADYLTSSEIRRFTVDDVEIPAGPLVLHVDVDVITSAELPGLLFPVAGGPSTSAVLNAVRRIITQGNVVALDLAFPWQPSPEHHETHARLVAALVT